MSTRGKINAITATTHADWPADDPLRRVAPHIFRDDQIPPGSFLICTDAGEERRPVPPGQHDVSGDCAHCRRPILWRSSAPAQLIRVCMRCWAAL